MQGDGWHGMHVRFSNVLDYDRYIIVPCPDRFIVRSGDKPTIFIDKRNCVDWSQVLVVFLGDVARIHIVLTAASRLASVVRKQGGNGAYLDNLFVRHTSEEDVLFVIVGVEADDVWRLAVTEPLEALTGLGVP